MTTIDYSKFDGHTPGPWTFDSRGRGFVRGADHGPWDSTIAILCEYATNDVRQQRQTANARLLAAAPTLLARCKALEEAMGQIAAIPYGVPGDALAVCTLNDAIEIAHAALAANQEQA